MKSNKMKLTGLIGGAALAILTLSFTVAELHTTVYKVDTTQSQIVWVGKKATGQHVGTIMLKEGNLGFNHGTFSSGKLVIDMNSIANTDIKDAAGKAKIEKHLKGSDFFDVVKYPEAIFMIKSLVKDSKSDAAGSFIGTGDLTMKGKTNEVTFPMNLIIDNTKFVAKGNVTFNRTLWDVNYNSSLGNGMIEDNVDLTFGIVGITSGGGGH